MRIQAYIAFLLIGYIWTKRTKWQKRELYWRFSDPFNLVESEEKKLLIRSLIATAFEMWQDATGGFLLLKESTDNNCDIEVFFARKEHGDKEALDGAGGITAHSGLPPHGYLHLDADEKWSFDGENGLDLRYVILHEIGHILGLRHTKKSKSVMSPLYRRFKKGMRLYPTDVKAIRRLYKP